MEREVERLQDEVATLRAAIEEALNKGQKSTDGLTDIPRSGLVSHKKSAPTRMNSGSGVVGLVGDFHRRAAGL